jgi:hypothetical protein
MKNPIQFANASGNFFTKALFYEQTLADKAFVVYTLKDQDHKGYPSLYRLYMECGDLTEYTFANQHLGGWAHWKMLCDCTWFKPIVTRWREELYLLNAAVALKQVQDLAGSNNPGAMTAAKYLLDKGWEKSKEGVGRPTKEAIKRKAKEMTITEEEIEADHARIFSIVK